MIERFLNWFTSKLDYKSFYRILPDGTRENYLVRYRIFGTLRGEGGRIGIYLHHIMSSDADKLLHCHPWTFISVMLKGSYREYTFYDDGETIVGKVYKAPAFLWRPLIWKHKLELEKPVWTLMIRFRAKRNWGFWITDHLNPMIPNEQYKDANVGRYEVEFSKDPDSE